ncbi:MAG: ABC transporter permease [Propionibacteriaceae bacterium]|nr:ABC transporter permease [Propionibacteriaceae bacterium]
MGNISKVVSFEISRTLKKASFWFTTLAIPALIAVVGVIAAFASFASAEAALELAEDDRFSFEYVDESGLIYPISSGKQVFDVQLCAENAIAEKITACFHYPADLSKDSVVITAQDVGLVENSRYEAVAVKLLQDSIDKRIADPQLVALVRAGVSTQLTTFRDGTPANGLAEAIAPLFFPVMLFLLIVMLGNQMLSAFLEEKEHRVAEMILTTINARNLLVGKLIGIVVTGLVQMSVFLIPALAALIVWIATPIAGITLVFDPLRMCMGALLLLGAFCLNMVSVVTVGMIMPTAKEAAGLFTPVLLASIMPLYASGMMVTSPNHPVVQVLTFFPWSGGLTGLVRNAFGTLDLAQGIVVIVIQFAFAVLIGFVASRIAQYGLISYTKALNLRAVLRRS